MEALVVESAIRAFRLASRIGPPTVVLSRAGTAAPPTRAPLWTDFDVVEPAPIRELALELRITSLVPRFLSVAFERSEYVPVNVDAEVVCDCISASASDCMMAAPDELLSFAGLAICKLAGRYFLHDAWLDVVCCVDPSFFEPSVRVKPAEFLLVVADERTGAPDFWGGENDLAELVV